MERAERRNDDEHVVDITSSSVVRSATTAATAANGGISRNALVGSRGQSSPLNSGYWILMEWVMIMSQIIAAFVVLGMSRDERPEPPLFTWVIGYASGCFAILPLLLWRFCNGNHDPSQPRETSVLLYARLKVVFEYYKMGLDCFFAVWFVVGNVWIFGGHSSFSDAPNLYRLCIVFLTFSCIGYAMPFILCTTICCCLPCIISLIGLREESTLNRGATTESINSLPTYKFKVKKKNLTNDQKTDLGAGEGGGIVAAGTEKEQIISGEDAVCCICLGKYANNDELRELTCSHFFHKICVDKWLKINASCPLCKSQVGESNIISQTEVTVSNASV